jgi:hypothetical protein
MSIILDFDDGDRYAGFVKENKICTFILGSGMEFSPDDDPSFSYWKLLSDLGKDIPSYALQGGGDVFGADVSFGKGAFVHEVKMGSSKILNFKEWIREEELTLYELLAEISLYKSDGQIQELVHRIETSVKKNLPH